MSKKFGRSRKTSYLCTVNQPICSDEANTNLDRRPRGGCRVRTVGHQLAQRSDERSGNHLYPSVPATGSTHHRAGSHHHLCHLRLERLRTHLRPHHHLYPAHHLRSRHRRSLALSHHRSLQPSIHSRTLERSVSLHPPAGRGSRLLLPLPPHQHHPQQHPAPHPRRQRALAAPPRLCRRHRTVQAPR